MKSALTTPSRRVKIDIEPWELLALEPLTHWCFRCLAMRDFDHNELAHNFSCQHCGRIILIQQLIVEGRLSECKYRGIESA